MAEYLEPLVRLPPEQGKAQIIKDGRIALSVHERGGIRYWLKLSLLDFPNDLASIDDLERFGVLGAYVAAIKKLRVRRPLEVLDRAG